MRTLKILGAALLSCFSLMSVGANAEQVPVSCSWSVTSSYGPPDNTWRNIVRQCKESNGSLVATQAFKGFANGTVENCVLTTAPGYGYTGGCIHPNPPSFYKIVTSSSSSSSPSSSCTTPGKRVHGGCANSMDPGLLQRSDILARCGSGCSLEFKVLDYTSACPNSGNGSSPEYGIFCK